MKLDEVKKLTHKKYRDRLSHFLVEGEHLILELFKAAPQQPTLQQAQIFATENYNAWLQQHNDLGLKVVEVGEKAMSQLSDTKTPQGIVAAVPFTPSAARPSKLASKAIYLHEIQDPGNLGTILRSLAWFGDFQLFLSANSVDPYNPKVVRSSMGAIFHLNFQQNATLADVSQHYPRLAYLDMQGEAISHPTFQEFDAYIFGNEARGVPHELLQEATPFTIPGSGVIESLNLASAVNMVVYELSR